MGSPVIKNLRNVASLSTTRGRPFRFAGTQRSGSAATDAPADGADAFQNVDIHSVFQPLFSPSHHRLVGLEALARARIRQEPITPAKLFAMAQHNGQTVTLDQHLLKGHLESFSGETAPVWLFLNISPDTCVHPDHSLEQLANDCRALALDPSRIVLEVLETSTRNQDALLQFVRLARHYGFQVAIDDFGTGDSNFERIWRLEPTIVKVDRSLLVNAENHRRARLLLESLVKMLRESGSLVVLEGIETTAQARIALETEADLLQGYLFARPSAREALDIPALERDFSDHARNHQHSVSLDTSTHDGFLRLLRFEVLETCHRLAQQQQLHEACRKLLSLGAVKRCFLLNEEGVQLGNVATFQAPGADQPTGRFNPLYLSSGARWSHREYFRNALDRPQHISASRPYVALPDAVRTITLSCSVTINRQTMVFCADLHPDEMFDGKIVFPLTL